MSARIRSARALRSPLLGLEGPHRPRLQRSPWPLVVAVLALLAAGLVAHRRAHGAENCPGGRCDGARQ